ncbi:MAG: hypothetical protein GY765_35990, partial [bacterium]|nr:hypothetical protein [bacterium]
MKKLIIHFTLLVVMAFSLGFAAEKKNPRVAVTIDDLPFILAGTPPGGHTILRKDKTEQLIKKLLEFKIPAIGFVVSG